MKTFTPLLGAIVVLLVGCATGNYDFTPYSGRQQNWPVQPGAFISTKYVIPAYIQSYPDRPYIVLGYLDVTTRRLLEAVSGRIELGVADVVSMFRLQSEVQAGSDE